MAWSDPGDFTSGQILTAAQMDSVREAMFLGQATFTNEAARDAAIPATGIALQEGMRAYLTAPTVPAALGGISGVPTGITTIYNGSVWVCTTTVAAKTNDAGTRATATYGALTGGGTNPAVTLVTGTTALVSFSVTSANGNTGVGNFASIAVSGATTLAAADTNAVLYDVTSANFKMTTTATYLIGSLTAGTNTFTLEYKPSGGTGTFTNRAIAVHGIA